MIARLHPVASGLLLALALALAPPARADSRSALTIDVRPDRFGASKADIQAVCKSAGDQLLKHLNDLEATTVVVSKGGHGPISLFARGENGEYEVRLDTGQTFWAQYAYQFAHELCHVLCRYDDDYRGNLWFEETLAELASLYCLREMATAWRQNAPYPNWTSFAPHLRVYIDDLVLKRDDSLEIIRLGLPAYYRQHAAHLTANPTDRDKNGAIAVALLPLFERDPQHWNAIRFLNSAPSPEGETFPQYLAKWHHAVPQQHRPFVASLARLFDISLP